MNEQTYNQWWKLHLRASRGETLNSQEQKQYNAGLETLDTEERVQFQTTGLNAIRQLRASIEKLQDFHTELMQKSNRLDEQIVTLEKAYQQLTGYQLAV
jgi:AAA15 family ATPase/GTPase